MLNSAEYEVIRGEGGSKDAHNTDDEDEGFPLPPPPPPHSLTMDFTSVPGASGGGSTGKKSDEVGYYRSFDDDIDDIADLVSATVAAAMPDPVPAVPAVDHGAQARLSFQVCLVTVFEIL